MSFSFKIFIRFLKFSKFKDIDFLKGHVKNLGQRLPEHFSFFFVLIHYIKIVYAQILEKKETETEISSIVLYALDVKDVNMIRNTIVESSHFFFCYYFFKNNFLHIVLFACFSL